MWHLQWLIMSAKQDKNQTKTNQPTQLKFSQSKSELHPLCRTWTDTLSALCTPLYSFLSLQREGLYPYTRVQVSELSFLKHSLSPGDFKVSLNINEPSPFVQIRGLFCWFHLKNNMFHGGISVSTFHKA